ncbi:hypothetical protein MANY_53330 [Mycolicibacterium anyangense]|jgi:hypothetical protein|uniref:Transport accessory protein MmpS3 n=1 Tax=Mycolicibacterium anyangense TaxID=1431246 RepID=A0A6N4WD93_9MYCO|nr:MmpS family transport accessory protein [Mycolicibacterium anyangense]BBZ79996.1 hypothetical protein MANY_53330 [Mycolicibacterium anyangense]
MNDTSRRATVPLWHRVSMTAIGVVVAAVATTFVVKTGDAASISSAGNETAAKRTVVATSGPRTPTPAPAPVTVTVDGLPPETPVLVPPSTPAAAALAAPMVDPRQVVYTVSGNQRPNDPVTVTYADETGALRTVENVALPWQLTVVPVVPVNYVTASSGGSQLNCWITDATGATVAAQTDNAISATCNR